MSGIDWSHCSIVQRDPEKMGCVSTVRAYRVSADSVIENHDYDVPAEEIAYQFALLVDDVRAQSLPTRKKPGIVRVLFDQNMPVDVQKNFKICWSRCCLVTWSWMGAVERWTFVEGCRGCRVRCRVDFKQEPQISANVSARKVALVVLGSNNWPVVQNYASRILEAVDAALPHTFTFIDMPLQPKPTIRAAG